MANSLPGGGPPGPSQSSKPGVQPMGMGMGMGMGMMMPPLPPNWSEHRAPNGTPYYFNNATKQSTYTRPLPGVMMPGSIPPFPPSSSLMAPANPSAGFAGASTSSAASVSAPKKKEKAKEKVPIPNTSWVKVITTENHIFYMNKETKKSSWVVPEEIKEEVATLEAELRAEKIRKEEKQRLEAEEERMAVQKERDRIRKELEEERRVLIEAERVRRDIEAEKEREKKRKLEEEATRQEEGKDGDDGDSPRPSKIARLEASVSDQNLDHEDSSVEDAPADQNDEGDNDEGQAGPVDEDDEEAWQRAVAAEIAAEHAEADKLKKEAKAKQREDEEEAKQTLFQAAPLAKVELDAEEGRALFKGLLYEKNISPFAPWESSLPLFINDPRYVLLSSQKDRRELYEEYCREVARARRLGKNLHSAVANGTDSAGKEKKDPEKDYKDLLKSEVKSTRMLWDDFRRAWKKDRRFFAFGKDDRQREKAFRTYQRELGERKRADAKRAELDFFDLLKEQSGVTTTSDWREVKRNITSDPRYDAVGSSSLREELFNKYRKDMSSINKKDETAEEAEAHRFRERKVRAEASLRERQQKVMGDRAQIERDMMRSKRGAGREEAEREFGSLLVQAVREHTDTWSSMLSQLESDPRYKHPALSEAVKNRLFNAHLDSLAHKRLDALHRLFETHASQLNTPFEQVFPEIVNEFAVTRLNLSPESLQNKYNSWQKVRFARARDDFDRLLAENSFVDFWGRMRNKRLDAALVNGIPEEDEEQMIDDEEAGGKANLMDMAKQVDLREMHSVLSHDKRYRNFDHVPDEREQWMREYLEGLGQATPTVHGAH